MALIFVPQYELFFDTEAGSDINWQLEILRSYEGGPDPNNPLPVPSDFFPLPVRLKGTGNPIKIEWQKDYDLYKPINGSSARIKLLVETAGQYADFNNAGPFEYQVRLRYRDVDDTMAEYWCGYITPLETDESVTTFPFEVNYTATDGLALLQDRIVDPKTSEEDINPIDTVLRAIYETGLDLPVYIDSKIYESSNDAIISATASSNSFYKDKKLIERITIKQAIEGYLLAFNCKIYQSNGRFYITNASTHGGTGANEAATFKRYEVVEGATEYTATTDSDSEDLIYTLNGTSTRDLIPAMDDLNLTIRRPAGSVECKPEGLTALEIIENGTFEMVNASGAPDDWNAHPDSLDQTLTTSSVIRLDGQRSLTTGRSRKSLDKSSEIWFQNTNGINIDQAYDFTISFDMLGELLKTSGNDGGRNVLFSFQVFYQTTNAFVTSDLDTDNTSNDPEFLPSYTDRNTDRLYFSFENNEWFIPKFNFSAVQDLNETYHTIELAGQDLDSWINQSVNIKAVNEWWHEKDERYYNIEPGSLYLRVFYLQTNKQEGRGVDSYQGNETGTVRVYLDNLRLTTQFDNDITDPTFERLQLDYNRTFDYKPRFASGVHELITQKLYPTDTYFREGETETLTLERIVTQQKLNDYRGGNTIDPEQSSLKYYEGTVINNTVKPFAPKDKLSINYADYTEPSCIFNGGIFEVKKNAFKFHGYVPNQSTDIAGGDGTVTDGIPGEGFYPFNVDLVAAKFPGRSNRVVYTLGFSIDTTALIMGVVTPVDQGLLPITENNASYIQIIGLPGQVIPMELRLVPISGYTGNPIGCSVKIDSATEPRPLDTTFGEFKNSQGDVVLPLSITIPENPEYEVLYIDGSISEFSGEATPDPVPCSVVIDWSTNLINDDSLVPSKEFITEPDGTIIPNPTPYRTTFNTSGIPGSDVHFTYFVESRSTGNPTFGGIGWNLDAPNFSISETATSLTNLDARQVGARTIAIDFEYSVPTTPESVSVELIGEATNPGTVDNPVWDYTVTFETSGDNFTLFETTNTFRGTENSVIPYNLLVNPNEGYDLRAGAYTYGTGDPVVTDTLPNGISVRSNTPTGFVQNGEEVVLPINVTIGDGPASGEITITGIPQTEPYSLTFLVNDLGSEGWTISNSQKLQPYGTTDFDGDIPTFTFYVAPNANMMFMDGTQGQIDAQVVANIDEEAIELPESQFTISRTYVDTGDEPGDPNVGSIKCVVAGKFPILTNLPRFPHHATVSINISGEAERAPATGATWNETVLELPGQSNFVGTPSNVVGRVNINSNGTWSVKTGVGEVESWITAVQPPIVAEGGVTFFLEELPTGTTTRSAVFYIYPDAATAALDTTNNGTGAFTTLAADGSQVAGSLTITQQDPILSGIDTGGYSLTGVAVGNGQFLGIATYTDGQGSERIISTSNVQTIYFCSNTVPVELAGSIAVAPISEITCSRGTVSGGLSFSDRSGDSNAIGGSTVVYTNTAPTTTSADGIYFITQ